MENTELIKRVQQALKSAGFDPGPIDGIPGRRTSAAIADFQKAKGLEIKFPGTIGPETIAALLGDQVTAEVENVNAVARPWFDLALTKKGLQENRDFRSLSAFLRSGGGTVGDPRTTPWCGDFVETCIAVTLPHESLPANPYLARNWLKFGVECEPQLGAVLVFWRGSRNGTSGHVAFDAGGGPGVLYCLGGNQADSVSVSKLKTERLLGARWPSTVPLPAEIIQPSMVGGKLSVNEA